MSAWSELSEAEKEGCRARYQKAKESGVGTITVGGQKIELGPMDPAARAGISVDEYLEKMHDDLPRMLEIAKAYAPLIKRLGIGLEFK